MTTEKSKKGRPTKFTSEISKDIINSLTAGATLSDAARYVGVTVTDIQHWIARKKDFGVKCNRAIAQKRILALKMEYDGIREGNQRVVNDFLNREERKRQNRENIKLKREENNLKNGNIDRSINGADPSGDGYLKTLIDAMQPSKTDKGNDDERPTECIDEPVRICADPVPQEGSDSS